MAGVTMVTASLAMSPVTKLKKPLVRVSDRESAWVPF